MLDTTITTRGAGTPAFMVIAGGALRSFGIDDAEFTHWIAAEGDDLACRLPVFGDACPGSTLSKLVHRALSAHVLVGEPGIELNVHGLPGEAGYFVQLNSRVGCQMLVGLTKGKHEIRWPPNDLTPSEVARHYLLKVCYIANALLNELLVPSLA